MGDRGPRPQSHVTVVLNASVIAFREGLEAILIFAALGAAILVVGSYVLAEQPKVRRPKRRGATVARRAETPPVSVT